MSERNYILSQSIAEKKLRRMAYEIVENNLDEPHIILAGIEENGSVIARNIQQLLKEISNIRTEIISITLDKRNPGEIVLNRRPDFDGQVIIVVDDVANSGKTMLYAMKPFLDYHPRKIQGLVLVERTHKAFPVKPDYVGISVTTTLQEHIYVGVEGETVTGAWME